MCLYSQPTQARNPVHRGSPGSVFKSEVEKEQSQGIEPGTFQYVANPGNTDFIYSYVCLTF